MPDKNGSTAGVAGKKRKLRVALVLIAALGLPAGALIYMRPISVGLAVQQVFLRVRGIQSAYIRLGDYRIHYLVGGEGRPLVLVHGLGARADSWAELILPLIHLGFRVYVPDLLGYGSSDRPDVDYSISLQAELLRRFLDSQNLKQADIAGWSMGGWISLKLAADTPARVRRLILMDSAGMRFDPVYIHVLRPKTLEDLTRWMQALSPHPARLPGFIARDILRIMKEQDWVIERSLASMTTGNDVMDGKLKTANMPVLLIWGREDILTPLSIAEAMKREMPQAELHVADGCGHLAPVACKDQVLPAVDAFLLK
jgi:pimeloyl-ACP methyl ester carboxylesterase